MSDKDKKVVWPTPFTGGSSTLTLSAQLRARYKQIWEEQLRSFDELLEAASELEVLGKRCEALEKRTSHKLSSHDEVLARIERVEQVAQSGYVEQDSEGAINHQDLLALCEDTKTFMEYLEISLADTKHFESQLITLTTERDHWKELFESMQDKKNDLTTERDALTTRLEQVKALGRIPKGIGFVTIGLAHVDERVEAHNAALEAGGGEK